MAFDIKRVNELSEQFHHHWQENKRPLLPDAKYGITVESHPAQPGETIIRCIGVYHLSKAENEQKHHVYLDLLNYDGVRTEGAIIDWEYVGEQSEKDSVAIILDKPITQEPAGNIPLWGNMLVSVGVNGQRSDIVRGLRTSHPDEAERVIPREVEVQNTWGHHSFYVVFKPVEHEEPDPPPPPVGGAVGSIYATEREGEFILKFNDERSHS